MRLSLRGVGDPVVTTDPLEFLAPVPDTPLTPSCMPLNASGPLQPGQSYCAMPVATSLPCSQNCAQSPLPGQIYCPGYCAPDCSMDCSSSLLPGQTYCPSYCGSSVFGGISTTAWIAFGVVAAAMLFMGGKR